MNKIEVEVLDQHTDPAAMMVFLARLTQRGHKITCMDDLISLLDRSAAPNPDLVTSMALLPHGTIKRFCPITIAIVGASRRFLAQARTHQVGINYVSASLQYSDYSGKADFVVPYALTDLDHREGTCIATTHYLDACKASMDAYMQIAGTTDNDTAGYAAPQGLRNILIMQANHEAWMTFINKRGCNRNTTETQYVTMLIWEALLKTPYGEEFFKYAGPDCLLGPCREGKMACGNPLRSLSRQAAELGISTPRHIINTKWPLLAGDTSC